MLIFLGNQFHFSEPIYIFLSGMYQAISDSGLACFFTIKFYDVAPNVENGSALNRSNIDTER